MPGAGGERIEWPVPFSDGIAKLLACRGRRTVMLASGDPFHFGAASVAVRHLERGEWTCHPAPSAFSLAASRLGWALERTACLGLHAAPFGRLVPHLAPGQRILATLRDGEAAADMAFWLTERGFGASRVTLLEALGGPRERIGSFLARDGAPEADHPLIAAIEPDGPALPCASGLPDGTFETDGQITKRPVRALALSALAPRPGETLWDIGAGSGSVSIEWLLSHPSCEAIAMEARPDRAARIARNAEALGADRLRVVEGLAPEALSGLPAPDAVFVGGGLSGALLDAVDAAAPKARLVAHAVTLESEALLTARHAAEGGELLRIELSAPVPLGPKRGWRAAHPVTQWVRP